ncbi:MAG TPA: PAS domain-containing protein, partial [Gemmatimonadaceae bacterium]|nr:PAS domain-containing protein [Gemmatimonadaceae bacterium]
MRFRGAAALIVLVMSVVVVVGWVAGIRTMQSFVPGWVTMKVNTAIALGSSAIAVLVLAPPSADRVGPTRRDALVTVLGLLVCAIGLATLAEYALGIELGIDQLVVAANSDGAATATPGRMAAVTALEFALLGAAVSLASQRSPTIARAVQLLASLAAAIALAALLGHIYGVIPVVGLGHGLQIAAHTAFAIILLSASLLSSDIRVGWVQTLVSRRAGGMLARRMLPFAVAVPLGLGALRLMGEWFRIAEPAASSAAVAVTTMFTFGFVIWRTAKELDAAELRWRAAETERVELALRETDANARAEAERAARGTAERIAKQKEEALAVLDLVLESSPVGFALLDPDLRFGRVNAAITTFTGVPADAHAGRTIREIVPHLADEIEPSFRRVLATGVPVIHAERSAPIPGMAGRRRFWLSSAYPLRTSSGAVLGLGVILLDTTERRQLESQLQQAQKMEAVGQLAGGVAHDFNNLLTAIKSFSELLALDLPMESPLRSDVGEISAAADRAAALTRQLLAFSRRQLMQPVVLDPNDVVSAILALLSRLIGPEVTCLPILSGEVGRVLADRGQLEQVLVNLAV